MTKRGKKRLRGGVVSVRESNARFDAAEQLAFSILSIDRFAIDMPWPTFLLPQPLGR